MSFFAKIIKTIDVLIGLFLVVFGVGLIYGQQWDQTIGEKIMVWLGKPLISTALGFTLALSVVFRILAGAGKRRGKKDYIKFKCGGGTIGISSKAIRDYIQRIGQEYPSIRKLDSKLIQHKNSFDVMLEARVTSGVKVREMYKVLELRVRQCICDDLGLEENLRKIDIDIPEIVGEPGKPTAAVPPAEETVSKQPKIEVKEEAEPQPAPKPKEKLQPEPEPEPQIEEGVEVEEEAELDDDPRELEFPDPDAVLPAKAPAEESHKKESLKEKALKKDESEKDTPKDDEPQEERIPRSKRRRRKKYPESDSQYVFKPKNGSQHLVSSAEEDDTSEEVELDEEDNPFLPE